MKFLVLVFSLLILRHTGFRRYRRNDLRLAAALRRVSNVFPTSRLPPIWRYLIVVFIPVALVAAFFWWLDSKWWGAPSLVIQPLLLIYLLLPAMFSARLKHFLEVWRSGDLEQSQQLAVEYFNLPQKRSIPHRRVLFRKVKEQVLYLWFDHLFVVALWYLVFGPAGALVPALTSLYIRSVEDQDEYLQLMPIQYAIEWLPVRILGITFAFTGNFVQTFKQWWTGILDFDMHTKVFLNRCCESALSGESDFDSPEDEPEFFLATASEIQAIDDLAVRSAIFWVCALAVATLMGWQLV